MRLIFLFPLCFIFLSHAQQNCLSELNQEELQERFLQALDAAPIAAVATLVRTYDYPESINGMFSENDAAVFQVIEILKGTPPNYLEGELLFSSSCDKPKLHPKLRKLGRKNWQSNYEFGKKYVVLIHYSDKDEDYKFRHGMLADNILPAIYDHALSTKP